jgi:hypothetical protein
MFRTLRFGVTQRQIAVGYINIIARRRGLVIIGIGTEQKYPEVHGIGGDSLFIGASSRTFPERYDAGAPHTEVHYPPCLVGWGVMPEGHARYEIHVTFYKERRTTSCEIAIVPFGPWDGRRVP